MAEAYREGGRLEGALRLDERGGTMSQAAGEPASRNRADEYVDEAKLTYHIYSAANLSEGSSDQLDLFSLITTVRYDGSDYLPWRDDERLTQQYRRVFSLMADGAWRTLRQIADTTGDPEASVSAQLRHMRKERFGSHTVEKRYEAAGLYHYRLLVNRESWRARA